MKVKMEEVTIRQSPIWEITCHDPNRQISFTPDSGFPISNLFDIFIRKFNEQIP
jgi:hypothetical protein